MADRDPIVRPVVNAHTPKLGPNAILVAAAADLAALQRRFALPDRRSLYMSRLHYSAAEPQRPVLLGPMMGAPYAALLLEIVRAWGVRRALFVGWCGSIDPGLQTGDLVSPAAALVDEGTSPHYGYPYGAKVGGHAPWRVDLEQALQERRLTARPALVWTTDALFRETPAQLRRFQQRGAAAVEMELSALLAVGAFHTMAVTALLAVSDELHTLQWRPGFKQPRFIQARAALADFIYEHLSQAAAWNRID